MNIKKRYFEDYDSMNRLIENYFKTHNSYKNPPTLSGLCFCLGISKKEFRNILDGKEGELYQWEIEQSQLRLENFAECMLFQPGGSATGAIFALKNRHAEDWKDKREVENTVLNIHAITSELEQRLKQAENEPETIEDKREIEQQSTD